MKREFRGSFGTKYTAMDEGLQISSPWGLPPEDIEGHSSIVRWDLPRHTEWAFPS